MNILSLAYLGNVQYYSKILSGDECVIDVGENYLKQSYRTRCEILGANGAMTLSVNVVKPSNFNKCAVKDIRIDNSKRWKHQHWNAIVSSYKNSPYFDYYVDMFEPVYAREHNFLYDLNRELMQVVMLIERKPMPMFSESYVELGQGDIDFRNAISPKARLARPDGDFVAKPYYQVFSEKMPFVPNLSIVDRLFCCGK